MKKQFVPLGALFPLMVGSCILAFVCLLAIPLQAAQSMGASRYISNAPSSSGSDASIEEVWMRHGGARLYYDGLLGPTQVNANGGHYRDPALVKGLPPIIGSESRRTVRKSTKASSVYSPISSGKDRALPEGRMVQPGKTSATVGNGVPRGGLSVGNGTAKGAASSSPALTLPVEPLPGNTSGAKPEALDSKAPMQGENRASTSSTTTR